MQLASLECCGKGQFHLGKGTVGNQQKSITGHIFLFSCFQFLAAIGEVMGSLSVENMELGGQGGIKKPI